MISLISILFFTSQAEAQLAIGFSRPACPKGYVYVSARPPHTTRDFCVMKYEAKNVGGVATSRAAGKPWDMIARGFGEDSAGSAWKACKDLGQNYDLISNDQWQTIARSIADTGWNWSGGTPYSGSLNFGHTDNSPNQSLEGHEDDNIACHGTGQTCSSSVWHAQRRTNRLPNGSVIWDFGGNVGEWVKDNFHSPVGTQTYISQLSSPTPAQQKFGHTQACTANSASPWCGYGYAYIDSALGHIIRGGAFSDITTDTGVFATYTDVATVGDWITFRCVYQPMNHTDPCMMPNTALGAVCDGNVLYAGKTGGSRYMITPGGCTNSATPTCPGTQDSLTLSFSSGSANHNGTTQGDGAFNTEYLTTSFANTPASRYCKDLIYGGYDDWFLPAGDEMLYFSLNSNSLPGFVNGQLYWTSYQVTNANGQALNMGSGSQVATGKATPARVRCARRY